MMDQAFLDSLASSDPTPGGGGASAAVGAVAAALSSMVGELTVGKKRYADVEEEVLGCLGRLAILRSQLIDLVDQDAEAFAPLAEAYKMPTSTPEEQALKDERMQFALIEACETPLRIMRACEDVLEECDYLSQHGSKMAISDAGASALLAEAAAESASLNVFINISSMHDPSREDALRAEVGSILDRVHDKASRIMLVVRSEIGA